MKKKLIGIIVCVLLLVTSIPIIGAVSIHTSAKPSITNLISGVYWVGVEYTFYITFEDPEGDDVFYYIDWGDGNVMDWFGPYNSGETASFTHYWTETGNYNIRMKAKDIYGEESDWLSLSITVIPPNRFFKYMEISGTLKIRPWRGLILSVINFDCATVTKAILGNAQLDPFTCHNYKFVALALNVHSYNKGTLHIEASTPFAIIISYR